MAIFSNKDKNAVLRQLRRLGFDEAGKNFNIAKKDGKLYAPQANTRYLLYHDHNFYGTGYCFLAEKLKEYSSWQIEAIYVLLEMKAQKNVKPYFYFATSYLPGNYPLPTKAEIEQEIRHQLDINISHAFLSGWLELERGFKDLGFDNDKDLILFNHEIGARAYFLIEIGLPELNGNVLDHLDIYISALPFDGIYSIDKMDLIFYRSLYRDGTIVQEPFQMRNFKISEGPLPTKDDIVKQYQLYSLGSGQFEGDGDLVLSPVETAKEIAESLRIKAIKERFETPVWPRGPD